MPWNFWRDAHQVAFAEIVTATRPRWSKRYVGVIAAIGAAFTGCILLHIFGVPGSLHLTLVLSVAVLTSLLILYLSEMLKYPANLTLKLSSDMKTLRSRLHSRDIAESSIIALSEHLSEMQILQSYKVRNLEQYGNWVERYQMLIQATYVILSKGVSNNVAMTYVSLPVVKARYISNCFNEDHMTAMFSLEKYIDKLQCIIDGHFLTSQHARSTAQAPLQNEARINEVHMLVAA